MIRHVSIQKILHQKAEESPKYWTNSFVFRSKILC